MDQLISFARALSDATRWRLLRLVRDEALCVCELADILEMPQSSVSSHLQVIRKAGLLASERCEKWIYYKLEPRYRGLLAELETFFSVSPATDPVMKTDAERAAQRLKERTESCCPGPKRLVSRSPVAAYGRAKHSKKTTNRL